MSYRIIAVPSFSRDAKRLSKKYVSLKGELQTLQGELLQNPRLGTLIRENTYKIRLAVKSKGKGKSGGLRIITHVFEIEIELAENEKEQHTTIVLVAIYDKSEMENLPDKELRELIDGIEDELSGEEN
jgi:mRNA-degrading endonuclease RelE of RelBE toxin-antitoxin system